MEEGFAILKQDKASGCLTTTLSAYLQKSLESSDDASLDGATFGDLEVGQLSVGDYGDDALGFRVTVPITISSTSVSLYVDLLYVRHANAVAQLTFESPGSPIDSSTSTSFTELATDKLEQQDFPALG